MLCRVSKCVTTLPISGFEMRSTATAPAWRTGRICFAVDHLGHRGTAVPTRQEISSSGTPLSEPVEQGYEAVPQIPGRPLVRVDLGGVPEAVRNARRTTERQLDQAINPIRQSVETVGHDWVPGRRTRRGRRGKRNGHPAARALLRHPGGRLIAADVGLLLFAERGISRARLGEVCVKNVERSLQSGRPFGSLR